MYVGSQAAMAFSPFIVPFTGFQRFDEYTQLMARPEAVDQFLAELESDDDPPEEQQRIGDDRVNTNPGDDT
jgi:hypothetical protein